MSATTCPIDEPLGERLFRETGIGAEIIDIMKSKEISVGPMMILKDGMEYIPAPLVYRKEYPTEPGWYWIFQNLPESDRYARDESMHTFCRMIDQKTIDAYKTEAIQKWLFYAGPITPPERPKC